MLPAHATYGSPSGKGSLRQPQFGPLSHTTQCVARRVLRCFRSGKKRVLSVPVRRAGVFCSLPLPILFLKVWCMRGCGGLLAKPSRAQRRAGTRRGSPALVARAAVSVRRKGDRIVRLRHGSTATKLGSVTARDRILRVRETAIGIEKSEEEEEEEELLARGVGQGVLSQSRQLLREALQLLWAGDRIGRSGRRNAAVDARKLRTPVARRRLRLRRWLRTGHRASGAGAGSVILSSAGQPDADAVLGRRGRRLLRQDEGCGRRPTAARQSLLRRG